MVSEEIYQDLYQSIKSIYLHIDDRERSFFSQFCMTNSRFNILKHLHNHPGISYIELSDLMLCTKGNITRMVQLMLEDNLINRSVNPHDRRSFQLFLSESGEILFKEVNSEYQDYVNSIMSQFNEDQIEIYSQVSNTIEKRLMNALCD